MNDISTPYSPIWERLKTQNEDSVTALVILYPYAVRWNDGWTKGKPILTESYKNERLNELGKQIDTIIKETTLQQCQITKSSINPYKVKEEKSENRLSLLVYTNLDTPTSKQKAIEHIRDEVIVRLKEPINHLLNSHGAFLSDSQYNFEDTLTTWEEFEELTMYGKGCRFVKGHFCNPNLY